MTPLAEPLCTDAPASLRTRAIFDGEACNWRAWGDLLASVKTGETAFERVHGAPVFDYLSEHPAAAASFDALMAEQTAASARAVAEACDFARTDTVVDVGGGYGVLLSALLEANPHMAGILFELPHVAVGARMKIEAAGVAARCRVVEGDFFTSVPAGGDAYLLKHILHDWTDEQCRRILKNCRRAMAPGARLLTVEILIPPGNAPDYGKYLDLNMLVVTGGRERTEAEYRALFEAAGLRLSQVAPTRAELSILEAVPV